MKIEFLDSIERIDKEEWDRAINNQYPFLKYEFLKALEITKCVSPEEGWTPLHLVVSEVDTILAIMPLYIKTDSQGEFVFDWSWADAFYRNGLDYYPKLVCSIPFTPASGPRLVITDSTRTEEIIKIVSVALKQLAEENNFSSVHILLAEKDEINLYSNQDFSLRTSYSFHWFNKEYKNFGNFLEDMTSRQRKNIKKERSKICSQGIVMSKIKGSEITDEMLEIFYKFYQVTYLKRGMRGYLNLDFFKYIVNEMPESILMVFAQNSSGEYVAGALNFYDEEKLYGRYWGCLEEYDSLHFETCYYQGIEFCIEEKLDSFDPGVQGEHKIKRGFCPIETFSAHWIKDIRFKEAIDDFLSRESSQGIVMSKIKGSEITDEMLEIFYKFYQVTYLKRGMRGYLNLDFFKYIVNQMPESILMVLAQNSSREYVAGALNFYDEEKLYGRYWGCLEEYDSLHFETCYYQGIEFCIEEKLDSFDPGVQGEHKIKRGFCPIETFSAHWIKDIRFKEAIDDFLSRERAHILEYNQDRKSRLPFRKEVISDLYEKI